jgi:ribonuclease P protein component
MLTFYDAHHKGRVQTGGRRRDSATVSFLKQIFSKDYAHEAHLSTEQSCARSPSRFPFAHVDRKGSCHFERTPCAWPQKTVCLITGSGIARTMRGYSVITKRSDFLAANRGKRYATPGFVLLVFNRHDDDPAKRLGITITKKVGNAVVRNRMRRRFRELAQELLPELGKTGADHILIGRDGGIERDFGLLRAELTKALGKIAT